MKAWLVHAYGEPEDMVWSDVPVPNPGPGEIRIKVVAAALNFFDVLQVQGKYQVKPPFPFTPGAEVSGIVDAVGEGVPNWAIGTRVVALPSGGSFAEYCLAPATKVMPMPASMDFAEAAALPIVYQTSLFALEGRGKLQENEWLLVHAGASGVGMSAIQLGKAMGAHVIATASTDAKRKFASEQGAEFVLDYTNSNWVDEVKRLTGGRGADVIYDPVGGDIFDLSNKCIAPFGRHLVIGFASGRIPTLAANRALLKNMSLVGVFWGGHVAANPNYPGEAHAALMRLYELGKIKPVVGARGTLKDIPEMLRNLANRNVAGKAVVLA